MSTSGGSVVNAVLYLGAVAAGLRAGLLLRRAGSVAELWRPAPDRSRDLASAIAIWLAVAVPSLLQLGFPSILTTFQRDPELIRRHGQWWRLVTSVAAQDGGAGGTAFNLVLLAVALSVAVPVWGWWRAPLVLLACQLAFDLFATFLGTDRGAGNSGATFGLAASLAGLAVVRALRSGVPAGPAGRRPAARCRGAASVPRGAGGRRRPAVPGRRARVRVPGRGRARSGRPSGRAGIP